VGVGDRAQVSVRVDVSDLLPVAGGHLDDLRRGFDELPATVLSAPPAFFADRERHLVARAALVLRSFEN
jgi:hypothetical protein